jgi:hypothetical protein
MKTSSSRGGNMAKGKSSNFLWILIAGLFFFLGKGKKEAKIIVPAQLEVFQKRREQLGKLLFMFGLTIGVACLSAFVSLYIAKMQLEISAKCFFTQTDIEDYYRRADFMTRATKAFSTVSLISSSAHLSSFYGGLYNDRCSKNSYDKDCLELQKLTSEQSEKAFELESELLTCLNSARFYFGDSAAEVVEKIKVEGNSKGYSNVDRSLYMTLISLMNTQLLSLVVRKNDGTLDKDKSMDKWGKMLKKTERAKTNNHPVDPK